MRAVAAANEHVAAEKVKEERDVANKMERLEKQARINEAINESVKQEEQRVIEAANKRMAEVHARKNTEANKAAQAIEAAKRERIRREAQARADEEAAVKSALNRHSNNVVA